MTPSYMDYIDFTIVVGFLVVTLVVGLRKSEDITTISEYALGGRNFTTSALVATIVATWMSGSAFFTELSKTYSNGLYFLIPSISMSLQILIIAYFLVPRMREFMGCLSVAEAMGNMYGEKVRFITGLCGILGNIGGIAAQFKVYATLFSYFLGIPPEYALLISSIIVITYSSLGGIKSVTYTDIVQFFTFSFVIPVIGIIIWHDFQNHALTYQNAFQSPNYAFEDIMSVGNPRFWEILLLMFYFSFPTVAAMDFQRISMGRSLRQVRKAMYISAFLVALLTLFLAWIPFLLFNINPNLDPNSLLAYIIDNYSYVGFKGLIIVGISAMAMSTADSRINASAVLFAHDLNRVFKIKIDDLLLSRISSVVLGVLALYLAMLKNDLLSIVMASASLYMPIVSVPLLFSILGFRSSSTSVLISMGAGFISVMSWEYLGTGLNEIIPSMVVNAVFLFGSHYLLRQKGGWTKRIKRITKKSKIIDLIESLMAINFTEFCIANLPKNYMTYTFFGVFSFVSTVSTIYLTHTYTSHTEISLVIYQSMLVISSFFSLYLIWSERAKHETLMSVVWLFATPYMLVFCSTFFVLLSSFGKLQICIFTMNIMLLFVLHTWQLSCVMIIIGWFLGAQFFKLYSGVESLSLVLEDSYHILIYMLLLISTSIVIFLKPKQEYLEQTEAQVEALKTKNIRLGFEHERRMRISQEKILHYNEKILDQRKEIDRLGATAQRILNNVNHELRIPIGNVMNFSEMIYESLLDQSDHYLKDLSQEVLNNSKRLSTMILNMLDLAMLQRDKIELDKRMISLSELVEARVKECRKIYLGAKKIDINMHIEQGIFIVVDANYMRQVIDNLVINAINFSKQGTITINLKKTKEEVEFTIEDEGDGIPVREIYDIFTPFKMSSRHQANNAGRGVGLALCRAAISAHGGEIGVRSNGIRGAKFTFVLPPT
jgi:Na+/proline symporter/signal transduction histidine kinase